MLCLSRLSILVFVPLTQHLIQGTMRCENSTLLCVQYLKSLPSWGFSCSPAWRGSFTTRVITGKMHSQSPILKTKGVLSNPVILTDLQAKLHPPYPNQTACLLFRTEKCLQCLKNVGLYNSFEVGRFSFWQSWLT